MIIISTELQRQMYRDSDSVNQSFLKDPTNPENLHHESDGARDKYSTLIGTAVQELLTDGQEVFDTKYIVSDFKLPSESIVTIIRRTYELIKNYPSEETFDIQNMDGTEPIYLHCLHTAMNENSYYMNRAKENPMEDGRAKTINPTGIPYLKALDTAAGKTELTKEEYDVIKSIEQSFRPIYDCDVALYDGVDDADVYYELPIFFELDGVKCKAMLDRVVHDKKTNMVTITDNKTTSVDIHNNPEDFLTSYTSFKYNVQAGFYIRAAMEYFNIPYNNIRYSLLVESNKPNNQLGVKTYMIENNHNLISTKQVISYTTENFTGEVHFKPEVKYIRNLAYYFNRYLKMLDNKNKNEFYISDNQIS